MLGTRRQIWLEGLAQQLSRHPDRQPSESVERMDPSALAARIGVPPKSEAPPTGSKGDGSAPWRKALRGS